MTATNVSEGISVFSADHVARSLLDDLLEELPAQGQRMSGDLRVVAELRGGVQAAGLSPQRLYVSLQAYGAPGFDARTLHWSAGSDAQWSRFPFDPRLPSIAEALRRLGADGVEVCRYVPLRRFTFLAGDRVVKVKRRSRLRDSWDRALAVETATRRRGSGVRVPCLVGVDDSLSAYAQAAVPGSELSALATGSALGPMLAEAGAVHARLHRLDTTGLPAGVPPEVLLVETARAARWTAVALPGLAAPVRRALKVLTQGVPGPSPRTVTCHGDLVPSHLIGSPGDWTVIDHDLAHRGEAERDLAMFIAGLAYDVPALADTLDDDPAHDPTHAPAVAAYLEGYRTAGGITEPRRLAWHLLAAHLHHAWLLATKDRAHPGALSGTAARLADAADRVEGSR